MSIRKKTLFIFLASTFFSVIVISIFLLAEVITRKSNSYLLSNPQLERDQINQDYNQGFLWNPNFLRKNSSSFQGWQEKFDTLKIDKSIHPIYMFKPNLKFKRNLKALNALSFAGEGDTVVFSTNSFGFRGREFSKKKVQNEYRIICLGASTTEGTSVYDWETYPFLLEKELQLRYPRLKITVINAGLGGNEIQDQLAIMEMKGYVLKPDLIIYYGGHNNVCLRILVKNMPCYYDGTCWEKYNISWLRVLYNRSTLFQRVFSFDSLYSFKPVEHEIDWENYTVLSDTFFDNLKTLYSNCKQYSIELILASIVNRCGPDIKNANFRIHQYLFAELKRFYPITIDEIENIYNDFNKNLESFCEENDIQFADIAKDYPNRNENFIGDLIHFSKKGNEEVVKRMLPYVCAKIDSFVRNNIAPEM